MKSRSSWALMVNANEMRTVRALSFLCAAAFGSSNPGTASGTYTFTITGTGNPAVTPAPTTTFTITVN